MKNPTRDNAQAPRALNSEELDLITGGDGSVTSSSDSTGASTDAKQKQWLVSNFKLNQSSTSGTGSGS